mgnify:CR=1 FL=1
MGHWLDEHGISPKMKLLKALEEAPAPQSKDQLRSFLGLAEYYSRFIPMFADKTFSMRKLMLKNAKFVWCDKCEQEFRNLKKDITSASALKPFNTNNRCIICTDASSVGLGAVLMQKEAGRESIIAFASRPLRGAELSYSTIECEALACWWGVEYFRKFVWEQNLRCASTIGRDFFRKEC